MTNPPPDDVRQRLEAALARVNSEDRYLLRENLNERTVSHRLAMYLQVEFPDWHVDLEYNRRDGRPKELKIPHDDAVSWEDTDAKTVFPDIIVHRRGPGPNLLVIELKKAGRDATYDLEKLAAYKMDLKYTCAALVRLNTGHEHPRAEVDQWV